MSERLPMSLFNLFRSTRRPTQPARPAAQGFRPNLESLEERLTPAVTVSTINLSTAALGGTMGRNPSTGLNVATDKVLAVHGGTGADSISVSGTGVTVTQPARLILDLHGEDGADGVFVNLDRLLLQGSLQLEARGE